MGLHWQDKQHLSEFYEDEFDTDASKNWDEEIEDAKTKNEKRHLIRKKLEERMEQKRLRSEIDDYEEEIHKDFDWNEYDQKK